MNITIELRHTNRKKCAAYNLLTYLLNDFYALFECVISENVQRKQNKNRTSR